jgi:transposase
MSARERADNLAMYLRFQGFRVLTVEIRESRRDRHHLVKVLTLEDRRGIHLCRDCGKPRDGLYQETDPVYFRDCSVGDLETYLEVYPWRVVCSGHTRRERFPFEVPGHRSRRFFERVAALCTRLPVGEVAKMAGLSWDTVARIDKQAIELALGGRQPSLEGLRWVGIDEVSRTGGHDYFTVVTDLETERVVFIGDGKGEKGLKAFLKALGRRGQRRIRGTTSDLGYLRFLEQAFPKATHLLDRFHIVKWLNEALKQLRRRIFGGAPQDAKGRDLKVHQWLLLSAPENLEHKHKLRLAQLVRLNEPLYRAYLLKEELRVMLHHPWKYTGALQRNLEAWYLWATHSRLPEMIRAAKRLRPHFENVIAGFVHGIKLGLVEAINGKIARLRASAHGYRDREYFKLKIFQRCSLPDNPWARIVL